jgi:methyl-accepting chemotaxis protein
MMSIAARLAIGFGIVMILSVGVSLFQLNSFRSAVRFLGYVTERDLHAYGKVLEIAYGRTNVLRLRQIAISRPLLLPSEQQKRPPVSWQQYSEASAALIRSMSELATVAKSRVAAPETPESRRPHWAQLAEVADEMLAAEASLQGNAEDMFRQLEGGRPADAALSHTEMLGDHQRLDELQIQAQGIIAELAIAGRQDVDGVFRQTLQTALVSIFAMLTVGVACAWVIGSSIGAALRRFMGFAQLIGQGDLTHTLPEDGGGEFGRMGAHLNGMRASLRNVATQTRSAAENVSAATSQIRSTAQEQAAASTEQLSAIEETSATLTEITQSGAQITARAQEVERNAQDAAGISGQGLRAVAATVAAMDSIREQVENVAATIVTLSERTQAINEITFTVNTIAERSHLLALNAAIEAAAAGEHGRTFTVVAGEIKRLADQARDATQRVRTNLGEIQQGINSSVLLAEEAAKRVEAGRAQTEATDVTIREMAEAIQESVQAFQQIVAATNQHQIGLEQVMQALASIRQAASQTSSTTRELESAATNLSTLSEGLVDAVRIYRL